MQDQDPWKAVRKDESWRKEFVKELSFKSLSLEWKAEGVIDGENEGGDWRLYIGLRWYAQDEVNQEVRDEWTEWGWRNEDGSWFHSTVHTYKVMRLKERLVICNEEDGRVMARAPN